MLSRPRQCTEGVQSMPNAVDNGRFHNQQTTAHREIRSSDLTQHSQACYHFSTETTDQRKIFGVMCVSKNV